MEELLLQWGGLAGCAALIAFLVNVLKAVGLVKDGQAQNWVAGLNLLGLAALLGLRVYAPEVDLVGIDAEVSKFVEVGVVVFAYVVQLLSSKATYSAVRGTWLIGKSNS